MNLAKAKKELIEKIQDKTLSTKGRGDALEDFIFEYIEDKTPLKAKKTKGSGALHGDGDIIIDAFLLPTTIDGKVKGRCTSVSVPYKEINKIEKQAAKSDRSGIIMVPVISPDNTVKVYGVVDMELLFHMLTAVEVEEY